MLYNQPEFDIPEIPDDITSVSDSQLMSMFSHFVQWQNYVSSVLVYSEMTEARSKTTLEVSIARSIAKSDEKQVTKSKAFAQADPLVVRASESLDSDKSSRKIQQMKYDALDRLTNFVSRELSRRIGAGPSQRRENRFGGG